MRTRISLLLCGELAEAMMVQQLDGYTIPVADAHCDFLYGMYQRGYELHSLTDSQTIYLPYLLRGGVKLQFFAAWMDCTLRTSFMQQCIGMIDCYYRMLRQYPDHLVPLSNTYLPESGKIATVLTIEGGEAIEGSLSALRIFKKLGVSAMTLTWNHNNELAGAAMRRNGRGLSSLGREVVQEMGRVGIAVDVSHLSDAAIDDVLSLSSRPIFASHSNARAVFNSPRGIQDVHIREIAARGGVVGVNFYYKQLNGNMHACINDIVRHIAHIADVGGPQCCCIGSDFDGMTQYPRDLSNSADFPALFSALHTAGFSEEELLHIAYTNLSRYIMEFV